MKFNSRQKDAFAKVLDNIGTANIVAILIGSFIESKVSLMQGIALLVMSVAFILYATFLRRGDE